MNFEFTDDHFAVQKLCREAEKPPPTLSMCMGPTVAPTNIRWNGFTATLRRHLYMRAPARCINSCRPIMPWEYERISRADVTCRHGRSRRVYKITYLIAIDVGCPYSTA